MTPDEAKALLPYVQAIAEGKVVEERFLFESGWSPWRPVVGAFCIVCETYQLRIVEPEPTQEEIDSRAFAEWTKSLGGRLPLTGAGEQWHAALAWERKRTSGGAK